MFRYGPVLVPFVDPRGHWEAVARAVLAERRRAAREARAAAPAPRGGISSEADRLRAALAGIRWPERGSGGGGGGPGGKRSRP